MLGCKPPGIYGSEVRHHGQHIARTSRERLLSELYAVGAIDTWYDGDAVSVFTVAVAGDTYKDGNSDNYEPTPLSNHSKVIADVLDDYLNEAYYDYDGLDVYRAAMYGDYFDTFGYSYAAPYREARKAALKTARAGQTPMRVSKKASLAAKKK